MSPTLVCLTEGLDNASYQKKKKNPWVTHVCLLAYNSPDVKIGYLCHFIYQMTFHHLLFLNYSFYLSRTHVHHNQQSTLLGKGVEEIRAGTIQRGVFTVVQRLHWRRYYDWHMLSLYSNVKILYESLQS